MVVNPTVEVHLESTDRRVDVIAEGFDVAIRVRFPPLEPTDLVMRRGGICRKLVYGKRRPAVWTYANGRGAIPFSTCRGGTSHSGQNSGPTCSVACIGGAETLGQPSTGGGVIGSGAFCCNARVRELFRGTGNFNSLIAGVYAAPKLGIGTLGSKERRLACSSG